MRCAFPLEINAPRTRGRDREIVPAPAPLQRANRRAPHLLRDRHNINEKNAGGLAMPSGGGMVISLLCILQTPRPAADVQLMPHHRELTPLLSPTASPSTSPEHSAFPAWCSYRAVIPGTGPKLSENYRGPLHSRSSCRNGSAVGPVRSTKVGVASRFCCVRDRLTERRAPTASRQVQVTGWFKLRLRLPSPDESDRQSAAIDKRLDRIVHQTAARAHLVNAGPPYFVNSASRDICRRNTLARPFDILPRRTHPRLRWCNQRRRSSRVPPRGAYVLLTSYRRIRR